MSHMIMIALLIVSLFFSSCASANVVKPQTITVTDNFSPISKENPGLISVQGRKVKIIGSHFASLADEFVNRANINVISVSHFLTNNGLIVTTIVYEEK